MAEEISIVSMLVSMPSNHQKINIKLVGLFIELNTPIIIILLGIYAMNLYSIIIVWSRESPAESTLTKGETYTLLHQHWLHTSLNGACYHLLQHHSDQPVVL